MKHGWEYKKFTDVCDVQYGFAFDSKFFTDDENAMPLIRIRDVMRGYSETFYNGEIPNGYQIDHINTIRDDNRIENLRCVTPKENMNNPLSRKHLSESLKDKEKSEEHKKKISEAQKGISRNPRSEFGRKFKEHYGITKCKDPKLYRKEKSWYHYNNNKCRWEVENA